ncbi:hypothetical protein L1887_53392 [Cichorium endivia]|nr:hypothetical protein L1887_53392 [Cichorium endivia]
MPTPPALSLIAFAVTLSTHYAARMHAPARHHHHRLRPHRHLRPWMLERLSSNVSCTIRSGRRTLLSAWTQSLRLETSASTSAARLALPSPASSFFFTLAHPAHRKAPRPT